jgi:hypothetical protein
MFNPGQRIEYGKLKIQTNMAPLHIDTLACALSNWSPVGVFRAEAIICKGPLTDNVEHIDAKK